MQTPDGSVNRILSNLKESDTSAKTVLIYIFGIAVIIALAVNYGIIPPESGGSSQQSSQDVLSVSGTLPTESNISSVLIYNDTSELASDTPNNSSYSIELGNIDPGNYTVYINESDGLSPEGKKISINQSEFTNPSANINRTVNFTEVEQEFNIDVNRTIRDGNFSINYNNPTNIRDIDFEVSPVQSQIINRSKSINRSTREVFIPGFPRDQRYKVTVPQTQETFTQTRQYTGNSLNYNVRGNTRAERLKVVVPEDIGGNTVDRTISVPESGRTETIQILSNQTVSPVQVQIRNGTSTRFNQVTKTWSGQDIQYINVSSNRTGFESSEVQISPKKKTTNRTIKSSTQDNVITPEYRGNTRIENASIRFTNPGIGSVLVDTNYDGDFECEVSINNGVCQLDSTSPESGRINISKKGISTLNYRINYTSVLRPENLRIDIGNNDINDISISTVVNENITESVEIPQQDVPISISSSNNVSFDYSISWVQDSIIDEPTLQVGSEALINEDESFVESKTYNIGRLEEGEYDFSFDSGSGGYVAEITWETQEGKSIPGVVIDGEQVCQPSDFNDEFECTIDERGLSNGNHEIDFVQTTSDVFSFQIDQVAQSVATDIQITVNGTEQDVINIPFGSPKPWNLTKSINSYSSGTNDVDVGIPSEAGIDPKANIRLRYQIDTGVVNDLSIEAYSKLENQTTSISIPDQKTAGNTLTEGFNTTIPSSVFTVGQNNISFRSDSGTYRINMTIPVHSDDEFEFNP